MPVVLRVDGFSFSFYAGDHEPPHVHVWCGDGFAIIEIDTDQVRGFTRMRLPDLRRARELVRTHRDVLRAAWMAWKLKREGQNDS